MQRKYVHWLPYIHVYSSQHLFQIRKHIIVWISFDCMDCTKSFGMTRFPHFTDKHRKVSNLEGIVRYFSKIENCVTFKSHSRWCCKMYMVFCWTRFCVGDLSQVFSAIDRKQNFPEIEFYRLWVGLAKLLSAKYVCFLRRFLIDLVTADK